MEASTDFNQLTTIKIKINNEEMSEHAVYGSPNLTPANDADLVRWVRTLRGKYVIIGDARAFPGRPGRPPNTPLMTTSSHNTSKKQRTRVETS